MIVAVIDENLIRYFTSGDGDAQQIAQLINPGLDVADVIRLGLNLFDALLSNVDETAPAQIEPAKTPAKTKPAQLPKAKTT